MQDQNNPYTPDDQPSPAQPNVVQPGGGQEGFSPTGKLVRPWRYPPETFKSLYTWWLILTIVGFVLTITLIGAILGLPVLIAAAVVFYIFLYKSWNQIQDGHQRTTPGKAVGFMFIPFYNLYWIFVAIYGFAQDVNAYGKRHGVSMQPVNEQLTLAGCILVLCSIIPYLRFLAGIASFVIFLILMAQFKNASMQIAAHAPPA